VAIQPGPGWHVGAAEPSVAPRGARRRRRRPRLRLAAACAVIGLCGIVAAGFGIANQLMPRRFTDAQRLRIEAWEVAQRWRVTPKTKLFPARVGYQLVGEQIGMPGALHLTARRLGIAKQATCASAAGAAPALVMLLDRDGCQAVLRATYTDSTASMVLTVGVAVLRSESSAISAAHFLTGGVATGPGAVSRHLLLRPVPVPGTPAAAFGIRQRQLAWVVGAGSYLVMATAGYADGRPKVPVASDSYAYLEMTSLARGIAVEIAAPLGARPPTPHCPGGPGC
jgi:hypothetical protein